MQDEHDAGRRATPASTGERQPIDLRGGDLHVTEESGLRLRGSQPAKMYGYIQYGFFAWGEVHAILEEAACIDRWRAKHNFPPAFPGVSDPDPRFQTPSRGSPHVTGDPVAGQVEVHCTHVTAFLRGEEVRMIRDAWALHLASLRA